MTSRSRERAHAAARNFHSKTKPEVHSPKDVRPKRTERSVDERLARSNAGESASSNSAPYVWYVVLLLCVVNLFNYMDRMALSVLMPAIKLELSLSDGQLGLLTGFAFFLFYAFCGIPIAWWADRGVRRNIVALALAVWSVMTALGGAASNFWHLFAARVGVGVGESGCIPPSQSLISDYVPLKQRPGMFALHNFGICAGVMIGMGLAGWLGHAVGWRWTFVALGLPGIALAVIVRLTLREPVRGFFESAGERAVRVSLVASIRMLWHCRTYRLLIAYSVVMGFAQLGLNQWWPSFYARTFGLSMQSIGLHLGVAIGVGSGIGVLIGGALANRLTRRDVRLPLTVGAMTILLSMPAVACSLLISSSAVSMTLISVATLLWSVPSGSVAATVVSVVMPRMRALASSLVIFSTAVLGFSSGPLAVGLLSDFLTPSLGLQALRYALLFPILFLPLTAFSLYRAGQSLAQDIQAAGSGVSDLTPQERLRQETRAVPAA